LSLVITSIDDAGDAGIFILESFVECVLFVLFLAFITLEFDEEEKEEEEEELLLLLLLLLIFIFAFSLIVDVILSKRRRKFSN
jgi:hypothetical protein